MNISDAVSMSANGKGVQGAVQMNLLQKAQDIQADSISTLLNSIAPASSPSVNPGLGKNIDRIV